MKQALRLNPALAALVRDDRKSYPTLNSSSDLA
jgi:hypothetical protein